MQRLTKEKCSPAWAEFSCKKTLGSFQSGQELARIPQIKSFLLEMYSCFTVQCFSLLFLPSTNEKQLGWVGFLSYYYCR